MDYLFEAVGSSDFQKILDHEGDKEKYVVMVTTPDCPKCRKIKEHILRLGKLPAGLDVSEITTFEFDGTPEACNILSGLNLSHAPSFVAVNTAKRSTYVKDDIESFEDLEAAAPVLSL